jgi:C1A family cysteine protease
MTDAIEALEEFGTCLESLWPYDLSRVNIRPDESVYERAQDYQIEEALQVNIDLDEMKTCLAQGFPFAFGLKLYTSFDKAENTGVVPMPDGMDRNRQAHGRFVVPFLRGNITNSFTLSHALLAVGYSDESRAFIVRNSWGERWVGKTVFLLE